MLKRNTIMVLTFLATLGMLNQNLWCEDYFYINISEPNIQKIPLAVPVFKAASASHDDLQEAAKATDLLTDTLNFTGYFKMLDRGAYLVNPQESDLKPPYLKFGNWSAIGAELLVTGILRHENDIIEMELRLYDPFKERLIVGKRYKGWGNDLTRMIRKFCSEIIFSLTGNRGIFESQIAFISNGSGKKEIYTCDFDGSNINMFTHHKSITLSPRWSSDSKWMAYTSYARGKPDLFIQNRKDKHGVIVRRKGSNITPAWVPGKFELAASLSFSGDPEIYLLTGKGKIIKRLTNSPGIDLSPTWSPDGRKLAFVSKRSGTAQVYIKDMDTGKDRRLTFHGKQNTQPVWSPKGDKIAYTGMEKGKNQIFVIGIGGNNLVRLTSRGDNESPSWSPDGSLIVFSSSRAGKARIYVMTTFGTDQRPLLTLSGEQTEPCWSSGFIEN
jgi:TolB protein